MLLDRQSLSLCCVRKLFLFTFALMWLGRLADPLVHSLAHDHHEHCHERGVHLHEAEDPCQWSDPATLQSYLPEYGSALNQAVHSNTRHTCHCSSDVYGFECALTPVRGPPVA
jgi:hypothetical protein